MRTALVAAAYATPAVRLPTTRMEFLFMGSLLRGPAEKSSGCPGSDRVQDIEGDEVGWLRDERYPAGYVSATPEGLYSPTASSLEVGSMFSRKFTAFKQSMRGLVTLFRVTGTPSLSASRISLTVALGLASLRSAKAPAT